MPNTKSAKKRLRQNESRRAHNRAVKSEVRTHIRKVRTAIDAGNVEQSESELRVATQQLDKAAAHGILHANKAARTKSRLSGAIKKLKSGASEAS